MFPNQTDQFVAFKQQQLLLEADHERLLAQLPHSTRGGMRHGLAIACVRVANWLDAERYSRPSESGHDDWVSKSLAA